jgi:hypothetical protein
VELYRPELNPALMAMVNKPIVQSLLYDADLLPEQLSSQKEMTIGLFAAYNRLEGVLLAFKYLEMSDGLTDGDVDQRNSEGRRP